MAAVWFRRCMPAMTCVWVLVSLLACGGGGGSSPAPTPTPSDVAPTITTQPTSQTILAGNSVTFSAAASGTPVPAYQWERSLDGTTWTPIDGATQASYSFTASTSDNGVRFHVKADNHVGTPAISLPATLTVQWAPVILRHPQSQSVLEGGTATSRCPLMRIQLLHTSG